MRLRTAIVRWLTVYDSRWRSNPSFCRTRPAAVAPGRGMERVKLVELSPGQAFCLLELRMGGKTAATRRCWAEGCSNLPSVFNDMIRFAKTPNYGWEPQLLRVSRYSCRIEKPHCWAKSLVTVSSNNARGGRQQQVCRDCALPAGMQFMDDGR